MPEARRRVPVRTFADWNEPPPGSMEMDCVAHCGDANRGSYVNSLVLTDIASGWTEAAPLVVRESGLLVETLERIRQGLPFALRALDVDNGSEFVNESLINYCLTPWDRTHSLSALPQERSSLDRAKKRRRRAQAAGLSAFGSYDALSRPTASTVNGVGNLSVTYSKSGNIATRTDPALLPSSLATYRYDAVHPHAVASVSDGTTPLAYQYDANGNLSTRTLGGVPYAVSWSSYNRPTSIAGPGVQSAFTYGADRERIYESSSYVGASGPETTIFIGGLYEVETTPVPQTHFKHFIPVPGGTTIVHDLQSVGGVQTTYITADHLGSGTLLLDHTGAPLITESYAAFGYRRNSSWSGALAAASPDYAAIAGTTRRGYTGAFHEMLDNLDLIHMNGRVYDPTIARFMSPDPVLDPLHDAGSQSWNPYSYTANRPLSYLDPTGEATYCAFLPSVSVFVGDWGPAWADSGGDLDGYSGGVGDGIGGALGLSGTVACFYIGAGGALQYWDTRPKQSCTNGPPTLL